MKPWGSQVGVLHFLPPDLPAEQRRWLAGGPGGGNERPWSPHGCGEICGTEACRTAAATQRLGDALDYSGCGTPRGELVPAQVSGYAAPPIRSDILTSDIGTSLRDRQSSELARLVPSTLAAGGPRGPGGYATPFALGSGRR